jgi:hypothetical protein
MPKREAEGFGQQHLHRASVSEATEQPFGLGIGGGNQRQRKALEARRPWQRRSDANTGGVADAQVCVHYLVFAAGRAHAGGCGSAASLKRASLVTPAPSLAR